MANDSAPKIQPWKALKSLEEDLNPDPVKLRDFQDPQLSSGCGGASVSKPMDRKTMHENVTKGENPQK